MKTVIMLKRQVDNPWPPNEWGDPEIAGIGIFSDIAAAHTYMKEIGYPDELDADKDRAELDAEGIVKWRIKGAWANMIDADWFLAYECELNKGHV